MNNWDATSTILVVGAIGAQILLIISALFSNWSSLKAQKEARIAKEVTLEQSVKIDETKKDVAITLAHVNSEKTADAGTIRQLQSENKIYKEQLQSEKERAVLLAQAAVQHPPIINNGTVNGDPQKSLENIDANTDAIKDNTKKTEVTVQELKNKA